MSHDGLHDSAGAGPGRGAASPRVPVRRGCGRRPRASRLSQPVHGGQGRLRGERAVHARRGEVDVPRVAPSAAAVRQGGPAGLRRSAVGVSHHERRRLSSLLPRRRHGLCAHREHHYASTAHHDHDRRHHDDDDPRRSLHVPRERIRLRRQLPSGPLLRRAGGQSRAVSVLPRGAAVPVAGSGRLQPRRMSRAGNVPDVRHPSRHEPLRMLRAVWRESDGLLRRVPSGGRRRHPARMRRHSRQLPLLHRQRGPMLLAQRLLLGGVLGERLPVGRPDVCL